MNRSKWACTAVAVAVLTMVGLLVGRAAAEPTLPVDPTPAACRTIGWTTDVANRPDSSAHGDWAKDTFTRTVSVYCNPDGTYTLQLKDVGTFTTTGPLSPGAGAPLAAGVTGWFSGSFSSKITSPTAPVQPPAVHDGSLSSSDWYTLLWPAGATQETGAWGWKYAHCKDGSDTWVNGSAGNNGDVVGKVCSTVEIPPPATTTTEPTTTTRDPATEVSSSSATSTTTQAPVPSGVSYANCTEAPVNLRAGEPGYRAGLDSNSDGVACEATSSGVSHVADRDLAYTGASPWRYVGLGVLLLAAGGAALGYARVRRVRR